MTALPTRRRWHGALLTLVALTTLLLAACAGSNGEDVPSAPAVRDAAETPTSDSAVQTDPAAAERAARLAAVHSWAYQLQGPDQDGGILDLAALAAHGADLIVVDFSRDGSDGGSFTPTELAAARAEGVIVLAYLSIGEAETYRDYWVAGWAEAGQPTDVAPVWLGPSNPDWPDNYDVRYWDADWQALFLGPSGYIERLVAAGFDGVYLDRIDAYEFWEELPPAGPPREGPLMAEFVSAIARKAHEELDRPQFLVFVQNAPQILLTLNSRQTAGYFAALDGIGVEDTFYFGDDEENNPLDPQIEALEYLARFRAAGKLVLAVDYLTDPDLQADFNERARGAGFVPFVAVRSLDRILPQPDG